MTRIRPRWRKIFREMGQNRSRNLLVILSMTIGVFAIGFVLNLQYILSQDMTASYLSSNPADVIFYVASFDQELVDAIKEMPEVKDASGRGWIPLRFQTGPAEWRNLTLYVIPDYDAIPISVVKPVQGAWPPDRRDMLVERTSVNFLGAQMGDTVHIRTSAGVERDLAVTGVAYDVNQRSAEIRGEAYGYISMDSLEWLGEPYAYDQLYVTIAGDVMDPTYLLDAVRAVRIRIEKSGRAVRYIEMPPTPGKHPDNDKVQAIVLILGVIGVFSLLSSALLVVNNIAFLLTQQVRQIGVMKAVGGVTRQIMLLYQAMIGLFSLAALVIAIPLAMAASRAMGRYLAGLLNFDLTVFSFPVQVFLIEIAVGLFVPIAATLYPILAGTRITIREAIASYGLGSENSGTRLIDRLLKKVRRLPRPVLLPLRNAFRRKGRLVLTLLTLVLGGTMFIAIANLQASTLLTLDEQLQSYANYDVEVLLRQPVRLDVVSGVAAQIPDLLSSEVWSFELARRVRQGEDEGGSFTLVGVPVDSQVLRPILLEGRWLRADDENGVVINAYLRSLEPDVQVGDEITLKVDGRYRPWTVVGITNGPLGERMAYTTYETLAYQAREVNRAQMVHFTTASDDPVYQAALGSQVEKAFTDLGADVSQVKTTADIRDNVMSEFMPVVIFLIVMAVLLALIGGISLIGTLSINVLERTREIGVLRAIGAADGTMRQIVMIEGIVVGVLSWLLSGILALPLGYVLSVQVGYAMAQAPLTYRYSWGGLFLWLGIAVLLTLLATLLPARRAMRISIREALAYE